MPSRAMARKAAAEIVARSEMGRAVNADLYEALHGLLVMVTSTASKVMLDTAIENAEAALAKARGEA